MEVFLLYVWFLSSDICFLFLFFFLFLLFQLGDQSQIF